MGLERLDVCGGCSTMLSGDAELRIVVRLIIFFLNQGLIVNAACSFSVLQEELLARIRGSMNFEQLKEADREGCPLLFCAGGAENLTFFLKQKKNVFISSSIHPALVKVQICQERTSARRLKQNKQKSRLPLREMRK